MVLGGGGEDFRKIGSQTFMVLRGGNKNCGKLRFGAFTLAIFRGALKIGAKTFMIFRGILKIGVEPLTIFRVP